jgi:two-component system chemotaxis response regulator CheY
MSNTQIGKSKRILVVDDEPEIRQALGLRLSAAGYDVLSAGDGYQGTQLAITEQPDAIVLDIGLPAGDGHTVAERLRANPRTVGIPVIYLTARTSPADARKARESGAFGYLIKPYPPQVLLSMILKAVNEPSAGHESRV